MFLKFFGTNLVIGYNPSQQVGNQFGYISFLRTIRGARGLSVLESRHFKEYQIKNVYFFVFIRWKIYFMFVLNISGQKKSDKI